MGETHSPEQSPSRRTYLVGSVGEVTGKVQRRRQKSEVRRQKSEDGGGEPGGCGGEFWLSSGGWRGGGLENLEGEGDGAEGADGEEGPADGTALIIVQAIGEKKGDASAEGSAGGGDQAE